MRAAIGTATALCFSVAVSAQQSGASLQASPVPREALMLLRVVNTVEAQLSRETKLFGSLAEVVEHAMFKQNIADITVRDSSSASVGDRTLILIRAEDRKRYQVMVAPVEQCGVTLFTNESGLIYAGRGLGC